MSLCQIKQTAILIPTNLHKEKTMVRTNEQIKKQKITALYNLTANILFNAYATENIVFGHLKAKDWLPFTEYIKDLNLQHCMPYLNLDFLNGSAIENGRIREKVYNEFCFELYRDKMDSIFAKVPINDDIESDYDIFPYKYGIYEYLKKLYELFQEIIKVGVSSEFFETIPNINPTQEKNIYYAKVTEFITAIKLKGLRKGSRVDRYFKGLSFLSPFIQRLIKIHNGHYILKNNDTDSLDYKLALLSCFRFYNEQNAKLFEMKILQWEKLRKSNYLLH